MNATFQSSAQVLSIGIFFTLMILGLSSALSTSLYRGLTDPRRPGRDRKASSQPSARLDAVRRLPRLQPGAAPDRRAGTGGAQRRRKGRCCSGTASSRA